MRNIILYTAASLDFYIARKDGNVDWLFSDDDYGYSEFYGSIDTVLMGAKTYRQIIEWENFPYQDKEVFVFTHHPQSMQDERVTFVSENISEFVGKLKEREGRDIWLVGGGEINTLLMKAGLIDEYILSVHPITLGEGIPLFSSEKELTWKLDSLEYYPSGLVQLTYHPQ